MRRKEILKHGGGEGGNFCARLPEKEGGVCVCVCVSGGGTKRGMIGTNVAPSIAIVFLMLAAAAAVVTAAAAAA